MNFDWMDFFLVIVDNLVGNSNGLESSFTDVIFFGNNFTMRFTIQFHSHWN